MYYSARSNITTVTSKPQCNASRGSNALCKYTAAQFHKPPLEHREYEEYHCLCARHGRLHSGAVYNDELIRLPCHIHFQARHHSTHRDLSESIVSFNISLLFQCLRFQYNSIRLGVGEAYYTSFSE